MLLDIILGRMVIAFLCTRVIKEFVNEEPRVARPKATVKKVVVEKAAVVEVEPVVEPVPVVETPSVEEHPTTQVAVFDGKTQYIELAASLPDITKQVTIEFWAKGGESLPHSSSIFCAHDEANHRILNIHLPWRSGRIYWDTGNTEGGYDRVQKAAKAEDYKGGWVHWAFMKNVESGTMSIYKNGKLWHKGGRKKRGLGGTDVRTIIIGAYSNGNHKWSGELTELRIWNRVLDAEEILAGMNVRAGDKSEEDGLVAYWPLDVPLSEDGGARGNALEFVDAVDLSLT